MDVNLLLAFGAGVLSFISPCSLPLYPAFLSYITGVSVNDLKEGKGKIGGQALGHTALFLLGFAIVFIALGLSTTLIGSLFVRYSDIIRQVGAIIIVIFGFIVLGVFKPKFLMKDTKVTFRNRPTGFFGSILIGMGFAAGWTPCAGPIIGAVIALGVTHPGQSLFYMIAYTLGFAVPFFILAFFVGHLKWIRRYSIGFMKAGGYLMIIMGVFLYFDWMAKIPSFFVNRVFDVFTIL